MCKPKNGVELKLFDVNAYRVLILSELVGYMTGVSGNATWQKRCHADVSMAMPDMSNASKYRDDVLLAAFRGVMIDLLTLREATSLQMELDEHRKSNEPSPDEPNQ